MPFIILSSTSIIMSNTRSYLVEKIIKLLEQENNIPQTQAARDAVLAGDRKQPTVYVGHVKYDDDHIRNGHVLYYIPAYGQPSSIRRVVIDQETELSWTVYFTNLHRLEDTNLNLSLVAWPTTMHYHFTRRYPLAVVATSIHAYLLHNQVSIPV